MDNVTLEEYCQGRVTVSSGTNVTIVRRKLLP